MISARFVFTALAGFALSGCSDETKPGPGGDASSETGGSSGASSDAGTGGSAGSGGSHHEGDAASDGAASLLPGAVVKSSLGRIQGYKDGSTQRFLGIRYAKPPVGERRWKPPEPMAAWTDVLDARDYGNACAQPSWIQGPESLTEDCLFLNVWTPDVSPGKPLPVMVWLPGGGNQNGAASDGSPLTKNELVYAGRNLATTGNVVVVTLNYRLGALGFFSHPALSAEDSNSGNQGLMDQRAALEWVRDNIAAFGGDPERVTLFGESAGSQDTCLHMVSPPSRGLFHGAISESGGCTGFRKTKATAEAQAAVFAAAIGCDDEADQLACLRGKSVQELIAKAPVDGIPDGGVDAPGGSQFSGGKARWDFNPVVDGTVIPEQPRDLVDAGKFAKVPYILGANFEEGRLFLLGAKPVETEAEYVAALGRLFGADGAAVAATYPVSDFADPMAALVRVWGDYRLGCSTYTSARRFAAQGITVRTYIFERVIPGLEALAATHGVELPYVFGTLPAPTKDDSTLTATLQSYWSRFATTGDPNGGGALDWPAFTAEDQQTMRLDVTTKVVTDFRKTECDFWQTIYDSQGE
jgi:para-nitrobenzyl esterase